ncbi:MAG: phage tail assembly chaperone [Paracoccaceae bacterium]|nr:phage tail assembly chaperone [Paracoccaceae bacterium]
MAEKFDWPALMRAGMGGLGLHPAQFWDLTPHELMLLLGLEGAAAGGGFGRARLDELARMFPDRATGRDHATGKETGG